MKLQAGYMHLDSNGRYAPKVQLEPRNREETEK
jgi:hypothetical protein